MLIFALESSAKPASAAVCSDGELLGQYFQNNGLTHSRTLMAMAESLLINLGISISDIDMIAVSKGPGSFTGVRIGVSAAKGLAWGLGKPVCGVSTLEAMAYQTQEENALICPVMDARREQVYNALFTWSDGTLTRLREDRAIALDDLASEFGGATMSPNPAEVIFQSPAPPAQPQPVSSPPQLPDFPVLLVGDGAAISHACLSAAGIPCRLAPGLLRFQTAYGVALAAMNNPQITAEELEPGYLRPSQAERERISIK